MLGEALVEKGFEVAVVPRVVEKTAADEGDLIVGLEGERETGGHRVRLSGARRALQIDIVLGQLGIFPGRGLVEFPVLAIRI